MDLVGTFYEKIHTCLSSTFVISVHMLLKSNLPRNERSLNELENSRCTKR